MSLAWQIISPLVMCIIILGDVGKAPLCFRWFCDCASGGVNKFDFRVEQPGWRGVSRKFCYKFSEILGREQDVRKSSEEKEEEHLKKVLQTILCLFKMC